MFSTKSAAEGNNRKSATAKKPAAAGKCFNVHVEHRPEAGKKLGES
jgi:hypothetical protein